MVKNGSSYYLYDRVSRLLEGHIYVGATGGGTQKWQSYSYDPFGNILPLSLVASPDSGLLLQVEDGESGRMRLLKLTNGANQ